MADIPKTSKAALMVGYGKPMVIGEVKIPEQLEPGSVLVKMNAASICASDVHLWQGEEVKGFGDPNTFPRILGHEMCSTVVRLGPGVTHDSIGQPLKEGDRLVYTHGVCGHCYFCSVEKVATLCVSRRHYMFGRATDYPHLLGSFAEYGYVFPTAGRVKVPDGLPDVMVSAATCPFRTMISAFDRLGDLDDRHSMVIQGAGPLGLFATAIAARKAPHRVIVVGGPKRRLEIARRWGATDTIDINEVPDPQERKALIMQMTDNLGPDVVLEVSGVKAAFSEGIDIIRRGGRYLIVGQLHQETLPFNPSLIVAKHLRLIGNSSGTTEHYYRALQFLKHHWNDVPWLDMISSRHPIEGINEAMAGMKSWEEVKPAIVF